MSIEAPAIQSLVLQEAVNSILSIKIRQWNRPVSFRVYNAAAETRRRF